MEYVMEFVGAALPWILMALAIAVYGANVKAKQSTTYIAQGMGSGIVVGAVLSLLNVVPVAIGVSAGMLAGLLIGMAIKK